MKVQLDHVGIVVNDLAAAKAFFLELGLELEGEQELEGEWLDETIGLKGVKDVLAFLRAPDGGPAIELIQFYRPMGDAEAQQPMANTPGIRHVTFEVEDVEAVVAKLKKHGAELIGKIHNYENTYKVCYIRGPEGILLELGEPLK